VNTILIALVWLVLASASGKVVSAPCEQSPGHSLFFVNGVWNPTYASARQSAYALDRLKGELEGGADVEVNLAYNPGDGHLIDLVEAAGQRYGVSMDWTMFGLWVSGEAVPSVIEAIYTRDLGLATIARFLPPQTTSEILQQHVTFYRSALCRGRKVVLVAHSQGNFFANASIENSDGLTTSESNNVHIVSVANPDNHIAGSRFAGSITLEEDRVISLVPGAMRAIYSNPPTGAQNGDSSKHQFTLTYLQEGYAVGVPRDGPLNSRRAIKEQISAAIRVAETGTVVYAQGGTDEAIQLSPPGGIRYYFLGYQAAGSPPTQPGYWTATRSFDRVRVRLVGGTGSCSELGPSLASASRLIDDTGQSVAILVADVVASGSGYCVFNTNVSVGARIAAVELSPGLLSTSTFTLAGSSQNSGRSLSGFGAERTGGFAFQFCAGPCSEPLGTPAPRVSGASCTTPVVGQAMTCTVSGTNLPATVSIMATNCTPSQMTAVVGGSDTQRRFTCTPVTAGVLVQVSYLVPGFVGPLPDVPAAAATPPPPLSWSPSRFLDADESQMAASLRQLACNSNGDAFALWRQRDASQEATYSRVWLSRHSRNGGWGAAVPIDIGNYASGTDPSVSINDVGEGLVAWVEYDGLRSRVYVRNSDSVGSWGGSVPLDQVGAGEPAFVSATLDGAGNAIVAWTSRIVGQPSRLWVANRPQAGTWSAPLAVGVSGNGDEAFPVLGSDARGNSLLMWQTQGSGPPIMWAVRFTRSTGWTSPQQISVPNSFPGLGPPLLSVHPSGNAVAGWISRMELSGTALGIAIHRFAPDQGWLPVQYPYTWQDGQPGPTLAQVSAGPRNSAIAVWNVFDSQYLRVGANVSNESGVWSEPVVLDDPSLGNFGSSGSEGITGAVDSNGTGVVAFGEEGIRVRRFFAGQWSEALLINNGLNSNPSMCSLGNGALVAAWSQYDPITSRVRVSTSVFK
jgi:hypothetical protein